MSAILNGELKDYTNKQLIAASKCLTFSERETKNLTDTAWKLAVEYIGKLKPDDSRGPTQVALASLVLAADYLGWTVEKRYKLVQSIDISSFADTIYSEMTRELDFLPPGRNSSSTNLRRH